MMAEIRYEVPIGHRFHPTDEQLISFFLHKKQKGEPLPEADGKILERRLYGEDASPWNVFREDDPWEEIDGSEKKIVYVFCKLIPVHGKNKNVRVSRTAGCGTWNGKSVGRRVFSGRRVIGQKRSFTFKARKGFEREAEGRGHWIMHEYSLPRTDRDLEENYVICKVTRDLSKVLVQDNVDDDRTDNDDDDDVNDNRIGEDGNGIVPFLVSNCNYNGSDAINQDLQIPEFSMMSQNYLDVVNDSISVDYLPLIDGTFDNDDSNSGFDIEAHLMEEEQMFLSMLFDDDREIIPYSCGLNELQ